MVRKLELLNMFVCEQVLGDAYVGGGEVIVPPQAGNASLLNAFDSITAAGHGLQVNSYQPWINSAPSHEITTYLSALEQPNSTVIPVPRRPSKACFSSPKCNRPCDVCSSA